MDTYGVLDLRFLRSLVAGTTFSLMTCFVFMGLYKELPFVEYVFGISGTYLILMTSKYFLKDAENITELVLAIFMGSAFVFVYVSLLKNIIFR